MKRILLLLTFAVFSCGWAMAQSTVSGTIVDAKSGDPVGFATVVVKGSTMAVISDAEGRYTIEVPDVSKSILVVNFVGYSPFEVATNSRTTINIKLLSSDKDLEEVVVTGFQNMKKQSFTGSSVKVSAKDLGLAGNTDISRALEGKVAGVSIQNVSSTFGTAPKVRIRGVTSITGENKPLWVVDGVVLEDVMTISNDQLSSGDPSTLLGSSVAGLNPNDIESMDILKDATATALYGARAMNGVIVITTKKGKVGDPIISYTGNFTVRSKPRYENFDILNSADQMSIYSYMARGGAFDQDIVNRSNYGAYGLMHSALNRFDPSTGFGLENTVEAKREFLNKYAKANTDWFDVLFTNKLMQEHSISISSGTPKSRTFASMSFMNDDGTTVADKVMRFTGNIRNDVNIGNKITAGFQLVGSYRDQTAPGTYTSEDDKVRGATSRAFDINPFSYAYNTSRSVRPYDDDGNLEFVKMNYADFNILHELNNNFMKLNVADVKAQANFEYKIIPDLKYNLLGSVRYVSTSQEHTITEISNVAQAYRAADNSTIRERNQYLWKDPYNTNAEKEIVLERGGFFNTRDTRMLNYNLRNSLSYAKVVDLHEITALGGMEIKSVDRFSREKSQDGYLYYQGEKFVNNPKYSEMQSMRQVEPMKKEVRRDRFTAFYLTGNYSYDERYSVDITVRVDGSNAFGKDATSRWLPTWNVGGKWNIINEKFMEDVEKIDGMSIRASYGLVATMPLYGSASSIFYNDQSYAPGYSEDMIYINSLGNRSLTWEKMYQFNVGYDVNMFRHRMNFSFDFFNRKSFGLLDVISDSGTGGFVGKYANYADLHSHGFDVMMGGAIIKSNGWIWNSNLTFGYTKNTIRNAKDTPIVFDLVKQTGGNKNNYTVNGLFSIPYYGLNSAGIPVFGYQGESDGWGLQSSYTDDLVYNGPVDPPYSGGLNNTVAWKGLSLNVFLSYQWGNFVRLHPAYYPAYSDLSAMTQEFKNRWVMYDDTGREGVYPQILDQIKEQQISGAYPYNIYNYSDARVAKGDFIKLKTIALGYDLPASWLKSTKVFKTANIRVTGKDLWIIYSDKRLHGQDPEFFNTGGVAMPALPQVIFSLNLGF